VVLPALQGARTGGAFGGLALSFPGDLGLEEVLGGLEGPLSTSLSVAPTLNRVPPPHGAVDRALLPPPNHPRPTRSSTSGRCPRCWWCT
jgi:hypothetical protein